MATTPPRHAPHIPLPPPSSTTAYLSSPRSTRTLRKLQSAQALSSHYAAAGNAPSLISQQRQLQHRSSAILREQPGAYRAPLIPAPSPDLHRVRTRANSEASSPAGMTNGISAPKRNAMAKKIVGPDPNSKAEIEMLIRQGPKGDVLGSLASLRRSVLLDGIVADSDGMSQLRIYIWLILLNTPPLHTDTYLALIHRGPSPAYAKIRNDTFRTLATDPLFKRRVSEASLIRLLNALAWTIHDAQQQTQASPQASTTTTSATGSPSKPVKSPPLPSADTSTLSSTTATNSSIYVQGLNVLAAPLLYAARSEVQAYTLLSHLLTQHIPSYTTPTLRGVHAGLALVDKILAIIDPKLSAHLLRHNLTANIYAFPSVLTLCACTPPLPEVLCLWDFLLAYGVHMNILCIVAQVVLLREELLATERVGGVFGRGFPHLRAKRVVGMAVSFVGSVGEEVYGEVVAHVR